MKSGTSTAGTKTVFVSRTRMILIFPRFSGSWIFSGFGVSHFALTGTDRQTICPCDTWGGFNPTGPFLPGSHLPPSRPRPSRLQESNLGKRQDRPAIAAQSEFQAATAVIWCVSGMLWGGALLQSVLVGAQTGWTRSRKVLAVIIMTSCVGAVGIDERASASRRFVILHVYQAESRSRSS